MSNTLLPPCMQLLSLVKSLRDTGHFTCVSVTRPFEFEGQRKVEAADRMIAALEGAAHLVVVVEQVLTKCCNKAKVEMRVLVAVFSPASSEDQLSITYVYMPHQQTSSDTQTTIRHVSVCNPHAGATIIIHVITLVKAM